MKEVTTNNDKTIPVGILQSIFARACNTWLNIMIIFTFLQQEGISLREIKYIVYASIVTHTT